MPSWRSSPPTIEPAQRFQEAVKLAFDVVKDLPSLLVTFGIVPDEGHTGLGYIHRGEAPPIASKRTGAYRVLGFKEKPDKATADRYVEFLADTTGTAACSSGGPTPC